MRKVDLKQGTDEWLKWRKSHFMASESAEMMDKSPFGNPLKLAHKKYGDLEVYEHKAMAEGKDSEAWIRDGVNYLHSADFVPLVVEWDENPKFGASLDGYYNDVVLEIKYLTPDKFEEVRSSKAPSEHYYIQIQHQLMVTGAKECLFIAVNADNLSMTECVVKPDIKLQTTIAKEWLKWAKKYENSELEPLEYEITKGDERAEIWQDKALKLAQIQTQIKELQMMEKELKESFINLSDGKKTRGYGVLVYPTERTSYQYSKFIKDNGLKIGDEYKSTTQSWAVKVG